ncbi:hypothetical protein BT63DRAFT_475009 [Microthyrium microscopicum]|uniref:Uncharacterized protein n=1 Tax=Microthyrium microscopicum TaxID=703497 RepID=A0A6A6UTD8_9PEZI|nr:hypothetical protein BT63DRAFT_475009 [Microthyrium microscopicum]
MVSDIEGFKNTFALVPAPNLVQISLHLRDPKHAELFQRNQEANPRFFGFPELMEAADLETIEHLKIISLVHAKMLESRILYLVEQKQYALDQGLVASEGQGAVGTSLALQARPDAMPGKRFRRDRLQWGCPAHAALNLEFRSPGKPQLFGRKRWIVFHEWGADG